MRGRSYGPWNHANEDNPSDIHINSYYSFIKHTVPISESEIYNNRDYWYEHFLYGDTFSQWFVILMRSSDTFSFETKLKTINFLSHLSIVYRRIFLFIAGRRGRWRGEQYIYSQILVPYLAIPSTLWKFYFLRRRGCRFHFWAASRPPPN